MNLSQRVKIANVLAAQAVGTASEASGLIDMQGYEGVVGILSVGAITDGATSIKAQGGNLPDGSDLADLAGTNTPVISGQAAVLDVYRTLFRYVKFVAVRGGSTGAIIDGIVAIQYFGDVQPPPQDASVTTVNLVVSPVAGAA
jgi:hypothetical protein